MLTQLMGSKIGVVVEDKERSGTEYEPAHEQPGIRHGVHLLGSLVL